MVPPTPMSSLLLLLLLAGDIGGEADPSSYPISSSSSSSDEGGVEDWTAGCPSVCRCKWVSGKRTAECQDRGLTRLPDFGKPDRIQVLHLEKNPLRQLGERIFQEKGLINLQKAYLSNCSLERIDSTAFEGLVILIELDLSKNALRTLEPGTFKGDIRIRKLWLGHNPIRSLSGFAFPHIPHLRILDLSHCLLNKLSRPTFMLLELLEVLHLNDNRFRRLDKRVFVPLRQLKSLTMEDNPWMCDCRLLDFWRWLMAHNLFSLPTACAAPDKLAGVTWDRLTDASLACPPAVATPEPMVTVSSGDDATLSCMVTAHPGTKLSWVRSGVAIANNTQSNDGGRPHTYTIRTGPVASVRRYHTSNKSKTSGKLVVSTIDGSAPVEHQDRASKRLLGGGDGGRRRWLNLTVANVHPSASGAYSCVASNEGGSAQANVTVVYSESVATYLDRSEMSALVVVGALSGVLCALLIAVALACLVARRKLLSSHHGGGGRHQCHHHPVGAAAAAAGEGAAPAAADQEYQLCLTSSCSGFSIPTGDPKSCRTVVVGTAVAAAASSSSSGQNGIGNRSLSSRRRQSHSETGGPSAAAAGGGGDGQFPTSRRQPEPSSGKNRPPPPSFSENGGVVSLEMKEMGLLQQQKPEGQVVVEKPDNSGEDSGSCTTVVNGSAARQQQNYSFDSVRTDSGCGSSIANAGSVAEGAAFNGNSGGNSSGSNSSGSGGGGGGGGAIILPPQAVIVIQHHHPLPPQKPQQHLSSPSGYGHQLHGSSSSPSSTMTPTPAASTISSASSAASSSTLKSSTFELPPLHSIMDRMWRRDLGSSNTHLLASSGNNSCESLPYSQWASPMHSRQQQQQQQQQYHQHLQQQQHLSGDFTLPRNYPGGIHQNPAASMGFPSAAVADSLLDSEDSGRLLYMARHQHQHPQLQQQQQQQPDLLRNHQPSLTSSSPRFARQQHHKQDVGYSPTEHLRAKTEPPSSSSSSTHPHPRPQPSSSLILEEEEDEMGAGEEGPAAAAGWRRQQPQKSAQKQSASATVNLLAQELEARKELLEALVKDKNDTAV